ncbi:MAG: hypothetical protein IKX14_00440 [Neisseriaceae bacterium]|nr:hypothetical protein [Neisseriaceae bacterium]
MAHNDSNGVSGCLKQISKRYLNIIRQAVRLDIIIAHCSLLIAHYNKK